MSPWLLRWVPKSPQLVQWVPKFPQLMRWVSKSPRFVLWIPKSPRLMRCFVFRCQRPALQIMGIAQTLSYSQAYGRAPARIALQSNILVFVLGRLCLQRTFSTWSSGCDPPIHRAPLWTEFVRNRERNHVRRGPALHSHKLTPSFRIYPKNRIYWSVRPITLGHKRSFSSRQSPDDLSSIMWHHRTWRRTCLWMPTEKLYPKTPPEKAIKSLCS